jgi:DNA-nicking Smr family endonuclease
VTPAVEPVDAALDEAAFQLHMRDVRPLGKKSTRIPTTQSSVERVAKPLPSTDPDAPAREALAALVASGLRFEVTDDGVLLEGRRMDADPRELRRLRTGRYPIDGKLDLHDMTAAKAKRAVLELVAKRRREGDRTLLIIHGKGSHSHGGKAILRGELGAWLSQSSAAKDVLAFASWLDRDGESGALCVLLARR